MDMRELPKIELHLHLDCSLSFDVVTKIEPSITLEDYRRDFIAPAKCTNLADFLKRAPQGIRLMQSERQLRLVVSDLFAQLEADNIIYAEIRFAPLQHIENGLQPKHVVEIVEQATREAIEETNINASLILCTLRHFSESQSLETVKLVNRFKGTKVAGFDIAADEAGYPIDQHIAAFRYAYDNKIPCTAHAGEARGPESVRETLEHFRPVRIGHGVRSIEDPLLISELKKKGIHLEVCPTCNVQIDVFDTYENHPIQKLFDMDVSLSVNTDARTITNINLTEEYRKLQRAFGWTKTHFLKCNRAAIASAFASQETKQELTRRLEAGFRNDD